MSDKKIIKINKQRICKIRKKLDKAEEELNKLQQEAKILFEELNVGSDDGRPNSESSSQSGS